MVYNIIQYDKPHFQITPEIYGFQNIPNFLLWWLYLSQNEKYVADMKKYCHFFLVLGLFRNKNLNLRLDVSP